MGFEAMKENFPILRPTATFPKGLEEADLKDSAIYQLVTFLTSRKKRDGAPRAGLIIGDFGTGKTSEVVMAVKMQGLQLLYLNASTTPVEKLTIMAPKWSSVPGEENDVRKITLEEILDDRLMDEEPFVLVIDEPYLAPPATKAMLMEILQEGSINDHKIPGLRASLAISNPPGGIYGRNSGFDIATADRFFTLDMTLPGVTSKLWKYAIAADTRLGINEIDLTKFYGVYERLDSSVTKLLPPRLLQFVLLALLSGLPASGVLPRKSGAIVELVAGDGTVVTDKVLDNLATALGVPNNKKLGDDPIRKILRQSILLGENPEFVGPHGIGKTAAIGKILKEEWNSLFPTKDFKLIKFSAPTTVPENNNIPVPIDGELHNILANRWTGDDEVVVFADEFWRASWSTMCQFMEIVQERSLGGHKLPLRCFIAVNNPKEFASLKYDVGNPSMPMMTRFWYHYDVSLLDSGWPEHLLKTFNESESEKAIMEQVIEWWKDDLTDADRVRMSARTNERLVELVLEGMPLHYAKAYVDGAQVPIMLHDLETRLAKQPLARLGAIAKKADYYEAALMAKGQDHNDDHHAVALAFQRAELSQLVEQRDLCVRLFRVLGVDHQTNMIRQGGERQTFWASVLKEGTQLAKASKPAKAAK
jgi:MoxR-like ATPase